MSFKKKIFKFSFSQKILAFIGYLYILFVGYTSKIQIKNSELPEKLWRENKPFILAFWHGQLMMIGHVWKSKAVLNMLASSHSDGRFGAYIASHFNLKNISIMSKNKSPSLRKVFKILKDGNYIGITPDGLIPLLEIYDKIFNKMGDDYDRIFSYKVHDKTITFSGEEMVDFIGGNRDRYGRDIDLTSGSHCNKEDYNNIVSLVPAIAIMKF